MFSRTESSSPNLTSQSGVSYPAHISLPSRVTVRDLRGDELRIAAERLALALGISSVTARILVGRGLTDVDSARAFLSPSFREHLPDPKEILNIVEAAALLVEAIERQEQIALYTDFDVDGLSAGAQLFIFLESLGARVIHYTPNRFSEGYGLVQSAIEKLIQAGSQLLVTIDCGITNVREIAFARRRGLKTIIVDHHQPHDLPKANVIVNPAQPGCPFAPHQLCAAGLVWMLIVVIRSYVVERWKERIADGSLKLTDAREFLDLAALGTICDMVPLSGLNRLLAIRGLEALHTSSRPGIIALKRVAGVSDSKKVTAGHVSFGIGPRINAAGRLDDAKDVFELLTTANTVRAKTLAEKINRLNSERRNIEEDVRLACVRIVARESRWKDSSALALFDEEFHAGVIGIVAQRLVEQFYRPAAVMAPGDMMINGTSTPVIKGSVRSIPGFHVAEALQALDDLLIKHGGHSQAGGFTLARERLPEFQDRFVELAQSLIPPELRSRERVADVRVSLGEIDYKLVDELARLAPFGIGNPSPLLVTEGVVVESIQSISDGHLRLRVSEGSHVLGAVAWRQKGHPLLTKGRTVNIAYQPELNSYHGLSSVQLNLREIWVGDGE